MIRDGKEVKENVRCWCDCNAPYHHCSSSTRRDGKKTVIYICPHGHRIFEEVNDPGKKIPKEKGSKKPKAPRIPKTTPRENEQNSTNPKTRNSAAAINRMS